MKGFIQRKHFIEVLRAFGVRKAVRFLLSRDGVALNVLMA